MTGLIQYAAKATAAGASASYVGIITGGSHTIPSEVREQRGIGSHDPLGVAPGLIVPVGTVDFKVQNDTLISMAERTTGDLAEFGMIAGDTAWEATYTYCKATGLTLHIAAGEELTASLSWMAKLATESTGAHAMTATSESVMLWNAFGITGLTGLTINTLDINLTHRIIPDPTLETPSAAAKRVPKYLHDTGQDMIGFNLTLRAQGGADITADALATIASIVISFKNTDAPVKTLAVTLTNAWLAEKNDDFTPDAVATKGLNYLCEDISWTYGT